jgi:hypothetical protein
MDRRKTPSDIETAVLVNSARRCALCFHLLGDLNVKNGQIAHLDKDPSNSAEDNLAFMCLEHHSLFDSRTSQHKNYTLQEVKMARSKLYEAIAQNKHGGMTAEDARMSQERARLLVSLPADVSERTSKFVPSSTLLEILYILPVIHNYGRTIARITRSKAKFFILPEGQHLPKDPDYDAVDFQNVEAEIQLPAEASVQPLKLGISNFGFIPVYKRQSVLWLYGLIDYHDIYGLPHQSRFCFVYHIPGGFKS